jgi:beta-fructofuranosidase
MPDYSQSFAPYGKFLWDIWFLRRDDEYHAFYLQASRTIDPKKRDQFPNSIGHAVSRDFLTWKELPTALTPSPRGTAWDDFALWSGSVVEKDGLFYLYYTGKNSQPEHLHTQKICLATSADLRTWTKHPANPLLEADTRYYDSSNLIFKGGVVGAWRDPFVFKDPQSETWYMTISARSSELSIQHDACVALATSTDLIHWDVLPPIFSPERYDEIEVTKLIFHQGYYYLFFTTHQKSYAPAFAKKYGSHGGLHCYYSRDLFGGYQPVNGNGVVFAKDRGIHDIRILPLQGNNFMGIGSLHYNQRGQFLGRIAPPIKLVIQADQVFVVE